MGKIIPKEIVININNLINSDQCCDPSLLSNSAMIQPHHATRGRGDSTRFDPKIIFFYLQLMRKRANHSFKFPGIIGEADYMHMAVHAPFVDDHVHVNRKNFYSFHVHIICNTIMQILNICCSTQSFCATAE